MMTFLAESYKRPLEKYEMLKLKQEEHVVEEYVTPQDPSHCFKDHIEILN